MKRALLESAGLALGMTVGGLFVGAGEGLLRGVSLLYACFLYGCLWALISAPLALAVAAVWRKPWPAPFSAGLLLSLVPSSLVLVRFIVLRDYLQEAESGKLMALGAGALAAALVVALVLGLEVLRRRLAPTRSAGPLFWLVPALCVAGFALLAQAGDDRFAPAPAPGRPLQGRGVILLVVDALRADALGAYGAPTHRGAAPSPNIDALARGGLLFADVSAQASWTKAAVASLLTSRHPSGHGTMAKAAILPESLPTIASAVASASAKTGAVVTNYNLEEGYGFNRGFGEYHYLAPARYLGAPERANRLAAYNVYRLLRERFLPGEREARHFYRSAEIVNAAGLTLLDRIGDGDFFLYLHYMEPHDPYFDVNGKSWAKVSDPHPPAAAAPEMHAAYRDEVQRIDWGLGELLSGIAARGLSERTTVILTADHGEEFAEHGGFYHGLTLYEEQLHVPLIIAGPDITPGVVSTLARQIDIAPTIAARLEVSAPASWEGRDLLTDEAGPTFTLAEENHEGNALKAIRVGDRKLITANPDNPRRLMPLELYDLRRDRGEHANLASDASLTVPLQAALQRAEEKARQDAASAESRTLDPAAEAELRSLGYVQ